MNRQSKIALTAILLSFVGMVLGIINLVTGGLLLLASVFSLSGVALNVLNSPRKKALEKPETDDNGYFINPARTTQIELLEEDCQIGEYAPGKSKYKCQHEFIEGACFWCGKAEKPPHIHSYRNGARRCATCGEGYRPKTAGNSAVEALEIALEELSEDTDLNRAMRISMEFVKNGKARLVKNALEHIGVSKVSNLQDEQIEPFIQRLLFESMKPDRKRL